ncbi:hypothetical protein ACWECC_20095 [Streptomyces microflavus]
MGNEDWTPDSIAHALPDAGMRQEFWRQFNLTPLDRLKALGEKWVKTIQELEAAVERGRTVLAHQQQHGGQLPTAYSDITDLIVKSQAA